MTSSDKSRRLHRAADAAPPAWRVPLLVAQVPETGQEFVLTADEATRKAVAQVAGVDHIDSLEAAFSVVRHGRDGVRVTGTVSARVGQTCVVTLEPLANTVHEAVDLVFLPPDELPTAQGEPTAAAEEEDQPDDPPEPLQNGVLDLGALAVEFLALGIDPYPRKPDARFQDPSPGRDPSEHPFAALAVLKDRKNGREN